jgi:hypothetical protein
MKKSTLLVCLIIGIVLNGLYFEPFATGFEIDFSSFSADVIQWTMRLIFLDGIALCLMFPFAMVGWLRSTIRTTTGKDCIGPVPIFSR